MYSLYFQILYRNRIVIEPPTTFESFNRGFKNPDYLTTVGSG